MGIGDERTRPEDGPCCDCGAPAVADCCRCERPVCLVHINKRVIGKYDWGREPYLVRFFCDACVHRYLRYAWLIGLICMVAVVAVVWVSVLLTW